MAETIGAAAVRRLALAARMWNWKSAKAMLERLWNHGDLVIARRQGFQRVYDLVEPVITRAQLEAPKPSEHERAQHDRPRGRQVGLEDVVR